MPQAELKTLLEALYQPSSSFLSTTTKPLLSLELDCCVVPLKNNLKLIQTTDYFYPLIDDPYTMGRITCCNVLSDLYAMGVVDCDNMLLLLGIPSEMSVDERSLICQLLMEGFRDCALEAGTNIRGGQTVFNPWLTIGGVATSVCLDADYIMPNQVEVGDVLLLTKPLGTQVAVSAYYWMLDETPTWRDTLKTITNANSLEKLFHSATLSMATLNRTAARLMHKYKARGCTDVTGFGLLGHANNLVCAQTNKQLAFQFHTIPCFEGTVAISNALNDRLKLLRGFSPETSGGLLIVLPKESVEAFSNEFASETKSSAWIIGDVISADSPKAFLVDKPNYLEISHSNIIDPTQY